jgi:hypothetical protein
MVILVGRGPLTCMDRSLCKYVIAYGVKQAYAT